MAHTPDSNDITARLRSRMPADVPGLTEVIMAGHRHDVDTARAALDSPDPHLRAAALGALERCGQLTAEILTDAVTDPAPRVRWRAAQAAAAFPSVDLLAAITDEDPIVAETALWACGEHVTVREEILTAVISACTEATEPLLREAAAAALGAIGDPRGLHAIIAACADKPAVRRRAVLALAPFLYGPDHDAVLATLRTALTDRDWQVRQAAEDIAPDELIPIRSESQDRAAEPDS